VDSEDQAGTGAGGGSATGCPSQTEITLALNGGPATELRVASETTSGENVVIAGNATDGDLTRVVRLVFEAGTVETYAAAAPRVQLRYTVNDSSFQALEGPTDFSEFDGSVVIVYAGDDFVCGSLDVTGSEPPTSVSLRARFRVAVPPPESPLGGSK
jgi:hypothetical protein